MCVQYLWKPKEGVETPSTGFTDIGYQYVGPSNQNQSCKCSYMAEYFCHPSLNFQNFFKLSIDNHLFSYGRNNIDYILLCHQTLENILPIIVTDSSPCSSFVL